MPIATFLSPTVHVLKALAPTAVLVSPDVNANPAFLPTATLLLAVLLAERAFSPIAVLSSPVVIASNAPKPKAVLPAAVLSVPDTSCVYIDLFEVSLKNGIPARLDDVPVAPIAKAPELATLAAVTASSTILLVVTEPSVGVVVPPLSEPSSMAKKLVLAAGAVVKVNVLPDTVKSVPGFCITPPRDNSI